MSKQKTQLKGKRLTAMVASIAMVAATALSLGAATYAWFTRGTSATADGFNFQASAAQGIQVSTSARVDTWKSVITADDFNEELAQADNNITLQGMDPVSTNGAVSSGSLTFFEGEMVNNAYVVDNNDEDFLMFDLYFLNQSNALDLKLDIASSVTNTDSLETALSTRVAFINQGVETEANANAGLMTNIRGGDDAYIWEPNSITRSNMALNSKGAQPNVKYSYEGLNEIPVGAIERDGYNYISKSTHTSTVATNDIAIGDDDVITKLAANSVTKLTIYVWMEGQDIDNDNSVSSGNVQMSLKFEAAVASTAPVTPVSASENQLLVNVAEENTLIPATTYTAYVLQSGTDTKGSIQGGGGYDYPYTRVVTQGVTSIGLEQETLTAITLANSLEAGDYTIVIVGRLSDTATSIVFKNITV